jgi:SecD/SecF fusion protein
LEDLAISDVRLGNEPEGLRFVINTSESQMGKVRETLWKVFGDKLAHNSLEFTQPKVIESPAAPQTPPAKPDPKQAEPPKDKQSHVDLPSRTTFAWAGDNDMLLALADEPAAAKPVAKDKPSIGAAPAQSVETPRKSSPRTLAPAESGEKGAGGSVTKPVVGTDPYAGGSQSQIAFAIPLSYQAVTELLATALASPELDLKAIDYQISNESYVEGDNKAYPKWTLKIHLNPEKTKALLTTLEKQVSDSPIFPASSTIGAAVAGNTQRQAIYALVVSWLCMIIYLWVRFQGAAFGIAAVVALIHDVFVMLGAVAVSIYVAPYLGFLMIEPFKINLPIVAAFLTIIGYSVNDTIVVFDRIREIRGKDPNLTRQMVNDSTNQTLSRTLLTSFTVLLVVVVLYLFGGEAVHGFAFALIVGVATGTYSSIYIAAPILLWLIGTDKKKVAA